MFQKLGLIAFSYALLGALWFLLRRDRAHLSKREQTLVKLFFCFLVAVLFILIVTLPNKFPL
jgi:hypothetical protein